MANFVLQVPNNLRSFTVSASVSSNGSPPLSSSGGSELTTQSRFKNSWTASVKLAFRHLLMCLRLREFIMASPVVIVMKLTSVLAFQQYAAKSGVEQKKLSGITSADFLWVIFQSEFAVFTKLRTLFGFCGKNWDGRALHLKFWVRLGVLLEQLKALFDNQKRF
ncbi:hypothetical protein L3X38_022443 [Prunus dulcis]|uniref:Uncharacterized protein n=1 Tax=Prunus dulcis TaxID=3755 RepID=A0AAD4VXM7_PRUDU|nr:hypothetical protein L3X38_022443 [Prunus dulcis]